MDETGAGLILAFEMTWTGVTHAPINAAMARAMTASGRSVRVHAEAAHLAELALEGVETCAIKRPPMHEGRTHVVSFARFLRELSIIRAGLRAAPEERLLIALLSATPTAIWAACLAARSDRRVGGVQVMLHGNLADATGWRPRNPLQRRFDLASTLRGRLPAPVRYVVFEPHILPALARIAQRAARAADVIPHPAASEGGAWRDPFSAAPLRIGFVGQGTRAKGFDVFLDLATRLTERHPGRLAFHLLGSAAPGLLDAARAAPLAEPPGPEALPRGEFAARMERLDYAMLPFRPGYYDLSASGALLDAAAWRKPVITTRVALTEAFFAAYGEAGEMADGVEWLEHAVETLLAARDGARHAAQAAAMGRAREARSAAATAAAYGTAYGAAISTFQAAR